MTTAAWPSGHPAAIGFEGGVRRQSFISCKFKIISQQNSKSRSLERERETGGKAAVEGGGDTRHTDWGGQRTQLSIREGKSWESVSKVG